jgi:hypothetical protein
MNSFMELLSFFSGERAPVSVSLSPSYATSAELGAYEFDATRRVYSHPIFKQNLPESQHLIGEGRRSSKYELAKRLAKLAPCLGRPPEPRYQRRVHHTRSNSNCSPHGYVHRRNLFLS